MIDYKDDLEDENKEEFDETFGYRTEELVKISDHLSKVRSVDNKKKRIT